ncbi:MAG: FAD-dependent oxidoreductase [Patescibacteria group bacterium]
MYDLLIIGGGPAGAAAGVYAARKKIKTLLITPEWGGQSVDSVGIQNWIGTKEISGIDFAEMLKNHVKHYAGESVEIKEESVEKIEKTESGFKIKTNKSEYTSKTVLITTGSHRRKLDIPGAKKFDGKGIAYCASCDAPLFSDQEVAVIGGGNAAFEAVSQLVAYAKSITLLNRSENFKADPITIEMVSKNPKVQIITNAVPIEIKGGKFVTTLFYEDQKEQKTVELPVTGIFVEIGLLPTTWFAKGFLDMNKIEQIIIDPRNQRASVKGIWAAGDCTDGLFHQNNIAAGDAVKALEDIYNELQRM